MYRGYIKIWRKIEDWTWFKDSDTFYFLIHLLLNANYKESTYKGYKIPRGSLVTGLYALKEQTGLSIRTIRTCMTRLKSTNDIEVKTTNRFSIISICNYDKYQYKTTNEDIVGTTNERQTNDKQTTTSKECKKEKNNIYSRFAPPLLEEVKAFFENRHWGGLSEEFFNFYESKGWKVGKTPMKNWHAAASGWISREEKKGGKNAKNDWDTPFPARQR